MVQAVVYVSRWMFAPVDLVNAWRCNGTVSDDSRFPASCDHVESVLPGVTHGELRGFLFYAQENPPPGSGELFPPQTSMNNFKLLVFAVSKKYRLQHKCKKEMSVRISSDQEVVLSTETLPLILWESVWGAVGVRWW